MGRLAAGEYEARGEMVIELAREIEVETGVKPSTRELAERLGYPPPQDPAAPA